MASEPRRLPTYPAEVLPDRWYCFHCPQHRTEANSMHVHLAAMHDLHEPVRNEDYGNGEMVSALQLQWHFYLVDAPVEFARQLDSLRGAEDFAFEVGDGAPIEKWRDSPA